MPKKAHNRSFSNDIDVSAPLEPRRSRRGSALSPGNNWPATTAEEDDMAQHDEVDLLGRDSVTMRRSGAFASNASGGASSRAAAGGFDDFDPELQASSPPLPPANDKPRPGGAKSGPVTWMSLPRKDQLLILFISRFVDFLQVASLQAYVFYQLRDMDRDLTDAQISQRAGILQGCFTGAQVMTAILWGKAADAKWCGRKWVLFIGMAGTAVSCLGYGFATTFFWAAFWRFFGGAINGTVGIIRTMVAEITKEKKYQSRAFLILPMSFNVASFLGPVMGGMLAEPAKTLPGMFGENAVFGFKLFRDYPFALPSLVNACTLSIATVIVFLFLEETSKVRVGRFDPGLHLAARIKQFILRKKTLDGYSRVPASWEDVPMDTFEDKNVHVATAQKPIRRLPFYRLWTRNVIFTLITGAFYDFQLGAFTNIWTLFLSTPRHTTPTDPAPPIDDNIGRRSLPLLFTGGMGMPASTVGVATSFLGILGMLLQVFMYPPVQARLGTLRSFRYFLFLFPFAYFVAPYLSILPSSNPAPEPSSGGFVWIGIIMVLLLQVTARTFTLPASIILLNNCSPHPSVLGTIHGLGQSVSAGFRTVGPVVGGWWYGYGLDIGMVAWGWWGTAAISVLGCTTALGMHEGSGHEIYLDGELEEDDGL